VVLKSVLLKIKRYGVMEKTGLLQISSSFSMSSWPSAGSAASYVTTLSALDVSTLLILLSRKVMLARQVRIIWRKVSSLETAEIDVVICITLNIYVLSGPYSDDAVSPVYYPYTPEMPEEKNLINVYKSPWNAFTSDYVYLV
jgi:hypothetical protein